MPVASTELASLQQRIAGEVTTPEMPAYDARRETPVPSLRDVRPEAVVACTTASDVTEVLALARRSGVAVVPRSGGHCLAGRSTTTGIVADVGPMDDVSVSGDVAVVGAGVRLERLYDALAERGRTLPAGCGATVGIAGLTLGGGLGVLGRSYGLTCNSLLAAEVVLADGALVSCDAGHHPDLFWGLRGGGGGRLGIVTSLTFRTLPEPSATAFELRWPAEDALAAVRAWQRWAPDAPDEVDATLRVIAPADPDAPVAVVLAGMVLGSPFDAQELLDAFVATVGGDPAAAEWHGAPFRGAKRWLAGRDAPAGDDDAVLLRASRSEFFRRDLPRDAVAALLSNLVADRVRGEGRDLSFISWGGAHNRVPAHATAFAHRAERFLLEHAAVAPAPGFASARDWTSGSYAIARCAGSGRVYVNFPDPELGDEPAAYHGENLARLRDVQRRYDPVR